MKGSDSVQPADPLRQAGNKGCHLVGLLVLAILVAVFVIAAWVSSPDDAPEPSSTGVPPTPPAAGQPPR